MDYKVNLVFPCDFEDEKEDEEYNKSYVKDLFKEKYLKDKFTFRYSSPIFSVNSFLCEEGVEEKKSEDGKELPKNNKMQSDKLEKVVWQILKSCKIAERFGEICSKFELSHLFHPYGIGLRAILTENEVNTVLDAIRNDFIPFTKNKDKKKDREDLDWIIYDKPLVVVEPCEETDQIGINTHLKFFDLKYPEMRISASNYIVVICNSNNANNHELDSVLGVFIALKKLSSSVRLNLKEIAPSSRVSMIVKKTAVKKMHIECALFDEIDNKNIFYSEKEQALFNALRFKLCVGEQRKQISSARDTVDFFMSEEVGDKTDRINDTLFITGYVGLILSFLAFAPIELRDILWIVHSLQPIEKIFFSFIMVLAIVCFIIFLRNVYYSIEKTIQKKETFSVRWFKYCWIAVSIVIIGIIVGLFVGGYVDWIK